ncbi:hypothetical protein F4805DRAFT_458870 [Annulohypoxylon moriforme]|nr:hypothetical protein F4805DRAFT_458870 [Annulohypoxylon moriforme]
MKSSAIFGTLATIFLLPATQATWCQLFYDDKCENSANGKTNFDCANNNPIGSGGRYIQCHSTSHNHDDCLAYRYNDASDTTGISKQIKADKSCIDMGAAGPYYKLFILS